MGALLDIVVALGIIGLVLLPLHALSSNNLATNDFTIERKAATHLALALVERYRDGGLTDLLAEAICDGTTFCLDDPHASDPLLAPLAAQRLADGDATVRTRVTYVTDYEGTSGLGRLCGTVLVTRGSRTKEYRTSRLIIDSR